MSNQERYAIQNNSPISSLMQEPKLEILPLETKGDFVFIWLSNEREINVIPEQISVFYSRLDSFLPNR